MPLEKHLTWGTIHIWKGDDWDEDGAWTNEKMLDELRTLKEHLRIINKLEDMTLKDAIEKIKKDECLIFQVAMVKEIIDFTALANVFETWEHLRTTCAHYGRVWLAQDESYLACLIDEKRQCDHLNKNCKDYEPMVKGLKTIDALVKEVEEWKVS